VCNPTGWASGQRGNWEGKDLNREFWRESEVAEVRLLEEEIRSRALHGLVSLHSDDTSEGLYGYAHGAVFTENLLVPALEAASELLPLNTGTVIDGFPAENGVIRELYEGVLRAPPRARPHPFEVIFETPTHAPQYLQETAFSIALTTVLCKYRRMLAYAQNI
jgi:hypothetical protein